MNRYIPIVSGVVMALSTAASADNFETMHKQLDIMSNIITSSVSSDKNTKISGVETTYLKGQGVVFTINSYSSANSWGNHNFNFVMPDIPPIAPIAEIDNEVILAMQNNEEFQKNINEQVSNALRMAEQKHEYALDSFDIERDINRKLREEQRDLSYQVRDLERVKRDLEYQMRRADKSSKADIEKQMKKLDVQQKDIKKLRAKLSAKSKELRQNQLAKIKVKEQQRVTYYQNLTSSLIDTFCLYGNGLKSVPRNENVSLIIKSGGEKSGRSYKDKIFVFSKKDISDCASDKINVAKLLERGKGYQF
ncbi:hypothetical protein AADZ91_01310 [Colwelliaceae bacterium 6441]